MITQPFVRKMLNVEEVAAQLGINRSTAYKLVCEEGFPAFRIGKRILISRTHFDEWLDRKCGVSAA